MIGRAMIVALALGWAGLAMAQAAFTPPEGDFTASFPRPPEAHGGAAADADRPPSDRTYVDDEGDRGFLVAVSQFRTGILPRTPDSGFYGRALELYVKASGSELKSSRPVELAGRPAIEGSMVNADGGLMVVRLVAKGDRIYTVAWTRAPSAAEDEGVRFFDSFRLTGP